jgi:hypothetical protein
MEIIKYNLLNIKKIAFNGFDYTIPEDTMNLISSLSIEVGSPSYIKTPIFQKRDLNKEYENLEANKKKRKGNKGMEISNDEWETLRTFQATKIEQKTGIDGKIDQLRLILNKLSDKTFLDICEKIKKTINEIVEKDVEKDDLNKIGISIFELASTNKFYSKIYADLYSELINTYDFLRPVFEYNFNIYMDIFKNIECGDADKDYDRFCEINKINEKRKSLASFYLNLMSNGIITNIQIMEITRNLLSQIYDFITQDDKKNEVDELTETVAILYKKEIYSKDEGNNYQKINGFTINEIVEKIAKSKVKDYKSLTNKSLFKFMDLIDM